MLVRSMRIGVPAVLCLAASVQAQTPRHESKAKIGDVSIAVEHGQPPWSEDRLGQIAQIPPGFPWRMGAEKLTTIDVTGGPVFFGDQLIKPAHYGFNLRRLGPQTWGFTLFDPTHEAEDNYFTPRGDEAAQTLQSTFVADAQPSVEALTIDITGDANGGKCELSWGPMRVSAPIVPVRVVTRAVNINSYDTITSWYTRPLATDADLSQPILAGKIPLEIDEDDCSLNVYVMLKGDKICALLRNVEREKWEHDTATMGDTRKQLEAALQQFGAQAEGQIKPMLKDLDIREIRNEVNLETSVDRPDNIEITEQAYDGTGTGLRCELIKARGGLRLDISIGSKTAVLALDEEQLQKKAKG